MTAEASSAPLSDLPVPFTSFVGRERELRALREVWRDARLVTLTGAGGSGKTRLALEAARREVEQEGIEAAWVELAPLGVAPLIGDTVLAALGVRGRSEAPPVERIAERIGQRPFLLVLDNAEHLLEPVASFVSDMLRRVGSLRILVTSRAALGVTGEQAWLVPPLSLATSTEGIEGSEAAQLFVQRARAVSPAFTLTAENRDAISQVCLRLDGLPLALELAAARLRALSPAQLARRLDDRLGILTTGNRGAPPRQQTLRATIDWSYELLGEAERRLLARLSVFHGSFSLEAAEAVASDAIIPADDVLDLLSTLVDQSLVEVVDAAGEGRYRLLETMREYAEERLAAMGEGDERLRAHATYFGALTSRVEPQLRSSERVAAMARLLPELENLRHALTNSRQLDVAVHLRLVGLLHWFWFGSGQWPEARQWLRDALALPEAAPPTHDRAVLLFSAGATAALQAHDEAIPRLREAEAIAGRVGDERLLAHTRNYLAMALNHARDAEAEAVLLRAQPWMLANGDHYSLRLNYLLLGQAYLIRGDQLEAVRATEEGVRVARAHGPERELGIALQQLASVVAQTGDWGRSRALLREALECLARDPMLLFVARALELMATSAVEAGELRDGARLYGAAARIRTAIGAEMWSVDRAQHGASMEKARTTLGIAAHDAARAEGLALTMTDAIALAVAVGERLGGALEPERTLPLTDHEANTGGDGATAMTPAASGGGAPALEVRAFGRLEAAVDGAPIDRKGWAYTKTRELLVNLLLHPAGRTREQIGVDLWPDASSAQLRNSFHVALHYLRRALAHPEWVRFERGRYRVEVSGSLDFDVVTMEEEVTRALRAKSLDVASLDRLRTLLVDRCAGAFLDGEPFGDWCDEFRERLARLWRDGMERLAEQLTASDRSADAAAVLQRVIEREPLRERAYQLLIELRARHGDVDGARADYRRLEDAFDRAGVGRPAKATVEVYRRATGERR